MTFACCQYFYTKGANSSSLEPFHVGKMMPDKRVNLSSLLHDSPTLNQAPGQLLFTMEKLAEGPNTKLPASLLVWPLAASL